MPNCCSFVRFIMADLMMQTVTIEAEIQGPVVDGAPERRTRSCESAISNHSRCTEWPRRRSTGPLTRMLPFP
jgi:hypothetical protein